MYHRKTDLKSEECFHLCNKLVKEAAVAEGLVEVAVAGRIPSLHVVLSSKIIIGCHPNLWLSMDQLPDDSSYMIHVIHTTHILNKPPLKLILI